MSDFARVALGLFAALAPFGAVGAFAAATAAGEGRVRLAAAALAIVLVLSLVGVALSEPFLDWLAVSAESFRVAAGVVMFPLALRLLWFGDSTAIGDSSANLFWRGAALVPVPVVFVAAVGYGARFDDGKVTLAALVAAGLAVLLLAASDRLARALGGVGLSLLGRGSGALLAIIAVELIIEGVQSV